MVNKLKKNPFLTRLFVCLVLFLTIVIVGVLLNKERQNSIVKRQELARVKEELRLLNSLQADYLNNKEKISALQNTVPSTYDEIAFVLTQLEQAASLNGQEIVMTLKDSSQTEPGGLKSLELTINASGSYSGFAAMMSTIASLPYHSKLQALQIGSTEGGLASEATLKIYIQDEKNEKN